MTTRLPMIPARPTRITSRHIAGSCGSAELRHRGPGSAPVTLLVFLTRAAPTGIVAADPRTGRGVTGLGPPGRGAVAATLAERLGHRVRGESSGDRRREPR